MAGSISTDDQAASTHLAPLFEQLKACGPEIPDELVERIVVGIHRRAREIAHASMNATLGRARPFETDDVLQEVFLKLVDKIRRRLIDPDYLTNSTSFYRLVALVISDLVIDNLRKVCRKKYRVQHPSAGLPDGEAAPHSKSFDQEIASKVETHEWVGDLSKDDADLIYLSVYVGMTAGEIADRLRGDLTDGDLVARVRRRMAGKRTGAEVAALLHRVLDAEGVDGLVGETLTDREIADRIRRATDAEQMARLAGLDRSTVSKRLRELFRELGRLGRGDLTGEVC